MRAIVVANGPEIAYPRLLERRSDDQVVAADGGTLTALRWGWLPDAVVGDLDSLPAEIGQRLRRLGSQVISFPRRKNWTDLELALRHAVDQGATEIVVVGARGGRLDQELVNILLLGRDDWKDINVRLMHGPEQAFIVRKKLKVRGSAGDTLSLIALTPQVTGLTTRGVEWPLEDAKLIQGSTLGVSNELTGPEATVSLQSGTLMVVHSTKHSDGENHFVYD